MNRKLKILFYVLGILLLLSCDYKKTQVINTVHRDGSVTRKFMLETNTTAYLDRKSMDIPIDSTWNTEITMDIRDQKEGEGKDTIWHLAAEKHFNSVEEINKAYEHDNGANRFLKRKAGLSKRFRWFTTVFRYSETVERVLEINNPLSDYLSEEELNFIYLPEKVQNALKNGPDSLKYKAFDKALEPKAETWLWVSEIRQWAEVFYALFGDDPDLTLSKDELLSKEKQFADFLMNNDEPDENSETFADSVFIALYGHDFYSRFKNEIDSAVSVVDQIDQSFWSASDYDLEIRLPGKIIASNGYAETDAHYNGEKGILWTVSGVYFLTEDYEMWAESRVNNYVLWAVALVFIFFVTTGFIRFKRRK